MTSTDSPAVVGTPLGEPPLCARNRRIPWTDVSTYLNSSQVSVVVVTRPDGTTETLAPLSETAVRKLAARRR